MQIRSIEPTKDLDQVADLGARTFNGNRYEEAVRWWRDGLSADPTYRPANQRILEVDGKIIGHALIIDRTVRVGVARLRMGGLGSIFVAPEYRHQGYARTLLQDCINHMARQHYDISLLNGIPNFYQRFGFATVWPFYTTTVQAADATALTPVSQVRDWQEHDLPALMALYEATWLERPGSMVRNEAYWRWQLESNRIRRVVVDEEDHILGYYLAQVPTDVAEVVASDRQTTQTLLYDMGCAAMDAGAKAFGIRLPPDDPFSRWARELLPIEIRQHSQPQGGWMGRFINVQRTFAKLTEELGVRLLRSPYRDWRGRVRIITDIGTAILGCRFSQTVLLDDGSTSGLSCRLSQAKLAQLLFGYRSVFEIVEDDDVHIARDAIPLIGALFPQKVSMLSGLDWF